MPSVRTCGPLVLSVLIGPLHLCPCGNGYRWRRKCEIDDIHRACLRFGRRRTIRYLDTAEQPVIFNIAQARYAGREIKVLASPAPRPLPNGVVELMLIPHGFTRFGSV